MRFPRSLGECPKYFSKHYEVLPIVAFCATAMICDTLYVLHQIKCCDYTFLSKFPEWSEHKELLRNPRNMKMMRITKFDKLDEVAETYEKMCEEKQRRSNTES